MVGPTLAEQRFEVAGLRGLSCPRVRVRRAGPCAGATQRMDRRAHRMRPAQARLRDSSG